MIHRLLPLIYMLHDTELKKYSNTIANKSHPLDKNIK